jgi:hypothetical protein
MVTGGQKRERVTRMVLQGEGPGTGQRKDDKGQEKKSKEGA